MKLLSYNYVGLAYRQRNGCHIPSPNINRLVISEELKNCLDMTAVGCCIYGHKKSPDFYRALTEALRR